MQDRAFQANDGPARNSQFSRRMFLGAGAAVAASGVLGMAEPAIADTLRSGPPAQLAPFGPVVVASPGGSYAPEPCG